MPQRSLGTAWNGKTYRSLTDAYGSTVKTLSKRPIEQGFPGVSGNTFGIRIKIIGIEACKVSSMNY